MGKRAIHWYLKEWLKTLGKKQSDIVRDLDWNKAKVSLLANGKQPYTGDDLDEVATYLGVFPYELLLDPADAMALRRMKNDALRIAASSEISGDDAVEKKVSLG